MICSARACSGCSYKHFRCRGVGKTRKYTFNIVLISYIDGVKPLQMQCLEASRRSAAVGGDENPCVLIRILTIHTFNFVSVAIGCKPLYEF